MQPSSPLMQAAVGGGSDWRHTSDGGNFDARQGQLVSILSSTFAVSLVGQFLSAVVLLIATLTQDVSHNWTYAIIVAALASPFLGLDFLDSTGLR